MSKSNEENKSPVNGENETGNKTKTIDTKAILLDQKEDLQLKGCEKVLHGIVF